MKRVSIKVMILTIMVAFVISGCVGPQKRPTPQNDFDQKIDGFVKQVKIKLEKTPFELYPAFVTAESLIKGERYTELEAHLVNQIKNKVPQKYRELSRQNWFELRESSPLTIDEPSLNIFVVHVNRNEVSNRAYVYASMRGKDGKEVFRNVGEIEKLDYSAGSIARTMDSRVAGMPLPEGMPENPYKELEKFAYGLTKELVNRYKKTKPQADQEAVADKEIRVYINTEAQQGIPSDLIFKAVRDRLLASGSFNCTSDKRDFKKLLEQIAYYQKHGGKAGGVVDVSEFRNLNIQPASIYLTIDMSKIANNYRVSMRAFWMSNPDETEAGGIIRTNLAGMYIAPFFGLAYVDRQAFGKGDGQAVSIQGRWEVRDLLDRTISGFYEITSDGKGKYLANKFGSDGSLQKRGIIINLKGTNVDWAYYDGRANKTFEVTGAVIENGEKMAVKVNSFPSGGLQNQELVRMEKNIRSEGIKITSMKILSPEKDTAHINDRVVTGSDALSYAYAVEVTTNKECSLLLVNVDAQGYGFRLFPTPCPTGSGFDSWMSPSVPKRYPQNTVENIFYIGLDEVTGLEDIYAVVCGQGADGIKAQIWQWVLNEICGHQSTGHSIGTPKGSRELPGIRATGGKKRTIDFERKLAGLTERYRGKVAWQKASFWHR